MGNANRIYMNKLKQDGDHRYRDLANVLPQLVVELNTSGEFIFINDAGLEFIGYSTYDLSHGLSIYDLVHEEDLDTFKEEFLYLLEGGVNKGQEFRIIGKNGDLFYMVFYLKNMLNSEKEILGLRGFIIDVSVRKQLERKIMSTMLDTEDRERRRYSEDLHDGLGPLLSTIKLYLNQMKSSKVTAEEEDELFQYTNELLDEAIVTTRNIANNILPGSIVDNGLIAAINSFIHHVTQASEIIINFNFNLINRFDNTIEINFYRILIELVNNSLKHSNADSINIRLDFNIPNLTMEYSDNGDGFDYNNTKSGLGLGNIRNRVNSLGGECYFESKLGEGMSFRMKTKIDIAQIKGNNALIESETYSIYNG